LNTSFSSMKFGTSTIWTNLGFNGLHGEKLLSFKCDPLLKNKKQKGCPIWISLFIIMNLCSSRLFGTRLS
jgi:hypothetical protein